MDALNLAQQIVPRNSGFDRTTSILLLWQPLGFSSSIPHKTQKPSHLKRELLSG